MSKFAKFVSVVLALGVMISAVPAGAQTMTNEQLMALVQQLTAQIATLQAQLSTGGSTTTGGASHMYSVDLTLGSSGADVTALQQFLVSKGFLTMPAGASYGYFGNLTKSALASYQASVGISPASGYFGPITRAHFNSMVVVTTTPSPTTSGTPTPTASGLEGGAGSIDDADFISSVSNEDVGEGQDDVQVLGMDIDADGSDISLTAVSIEFEDQDAAGSEDLDDYADEVTVWLGTTQVGSADVDDFNENNGIWSETINLSNAIIRDGDSGKLYIAVSALNNIDSTDLAGNNWRVGIKSIRFMDAQGAVITDSTTGDIGSDLSVGTTATRDFQFKSFATANDVDLKISKASDNPSAQTVVAEEGDEVVLLIGDMEAEGSDIEVTSLTATITPTTLGVDDIASEYILRIDGEDMESMDANAGSTTTDATASAFVFNDFKFTVEEGETVNFEIVAVLQDPEDYTNNTDSISASVTAAAIEAEDESGEDLSSSELTGTANGNLQTIILAGAAVDSFDGSDATSIINQDTGSTTRITWEITFDVTAYEQDVYIPVSAVEATTTAHGTTNGVAFSLYAGSTLLDAASTTATASLTSTADQDSGYFVVEEGDTETITLTVNMTGSTVQGNMKVQLEELLYQADSTGDTDAKFLFTPENDYDSDTELWQL